MYRIMYSIGHAFFKIIRTTQYPLRTIYIISCARLDISRTTYLLCITYYLVCQTYHLMRTIDIYYGSRMVPGKKKYFIWRPPLIMWRPPFNLSGGRQINWAILRMRIYSKLLIWTVTHSLGKR